MTTAIERARSLLSPPGDTIQEHIDFIGMSQAELAERMGRPKEKINDIIKGREPVTIATAFQLENVLGIPASFWLNREKAYRKELYELQQQEEYHRDKEWLRCFPINELQKMGWLPETKEKHLLVNGLLKFFGVASKDEWERIYIDKEVSVAFRVSLARTKSPHAISAWLRMGELQVAEMKLLVFDKKRFRDVLPDIRELAYVMPEGYEKKLQNICSKCGVAVVFTPRLSKAPILGAVRWFRTNPMVQLSGDFKTDDHLWHTFFHEAAHIILHGKKDIFLENVDGTEQDRDKEEEANIFADKILLTDKELQELMNSLPMTEKKIHKFSKKFRTPVGAVVKRLKQLGIY